MKTCDIGIHLALVLRMLGRLTEKFFLLAFNLSHKNKGNRKKGSKKIIESILVLFWLIIKKDFTHYFKEVYFSPVFTFYTLTESYRFCFLLGTKLPSLSSGPMPRGPVSRTHIRGLLFSKSRISRFLFSKSRINPLLSSKDRHTRFLFSGNRIRHPL